jgi:hypothetical protein
MKTFIIYNSVNPKSVKNAEESLNSFNKFNGWNASLYDGCHPGIIHEYDEKYNIQKQRKIKRGGHNENKRSCFYSHYACWHWAASNNELIVVAEHDTECVSDYNLDQFVSLSDTLAVQLTLDTMLIKGQNPNQGYNKAEVQRQHAKNGEGFHKIFYKHAHGKYIMAGHTGYLITPSAAKIVIEDCQMHGWMQNDLLIEDSFFPLYYISPSPIDYKVNKELKTSGKGW